MPTASELDDFTAEMKQIFGSHVQAPNRSRAEQRRWWEDCYRPRSEERYKFITRFLDDPQASVCRVTGHIGAGKTCFVYDKLQNPASRVCDGIIVDIQNFAGDLHGAQAHARTKHLELVDRGIDSGITLHERITDLVPLRLNQIVAGAVSYQFRRHFGRQLLNPGANPFDLDVEHRLDLDVQDPSPDDFESHGAEINRRVAGALILVSASPELAVFREEAYSEREREAMALSRSRRHDLICDRLRQVPELVLSVTRAESESAEDSERLARRWLKAYTRFFRVERPVLVFDNIDKVHSQALCAAVVRYARNLAGALRDLAPKATAPTGQDPIPAADFKVVLTIRNWNMPSGAPYSEGGVTREVGIALIEEGAGHPLVCQTALHMPLDLALLQAAIPARFGHARNIFRAKIESAQEELEKLAHRHEELEKDLAGAKRGGERAAFERAETGLTRVAKACQDLERKLATARLCLDMLPMLESPTEHVWFETPSTLPLRELANGSLGDALRIACHVGCKLITDTYADNRDVQTLLDANRAMALRPRVIDWLFDIEESGRDLAQHIREARSRVESEQSELLCCPHRLVLTYLWRQWEASGGKNRRVYVGDVIRQLKVFSGTPEEETRQALFYLFQTSTGRQADFITIYQDQAIEGPEGIVAEGPGQALVHINPKGRAVLEKVMPRVEYWARLAEVSDPPALLQELVPEQALKLMSPIEGMVRRMVDVHRRNWGIVVREHLRGHADKTKPFKIFQRAGLIYKQEFYLSRVVNSHLEALRSFFNSLLGVPLPPGPIQRDMYGEFGDQWPKLDGIADSVNGPVDLQQLLEFIDEYEEARNDPGQRLTIQELKRLLKSYHDMAAKMTALCDRTLTSFLDDAQTTNGED